MNLASYLCSTPLLVKPLGWERVAHPQVGGFPL